MPLFNSRIAKATGEVIDGQFVHVLRFNDAGKLAKMDIYEFSADR